MAEQSEELKATIASINAGDEVDITYGKVRMQFVVECVDWDDDLVPEGGRPTHIFGHGITEVHSIKRPEMPEPGHCERMIDRRGIAWVRDSDNDWVSLDGEGDWADWLELTRRHGPMRPFSYDLIGVPLPQAGV